MALDNTKNFAKGTLFTGYDDAATTIELQSGHGARFPAAPFNATWWNSTDYADPSDDPDVEIIRVVSFSSGDVMNITRAQEGTTATVKNVGGKTYSLIAGVTAHTIQQIESNKADVTHTHQGGVVFTFYRASGLQVGDKIKTIIPYAGTMTDWVLTTIDEAPATIQFNTARISEGDIPNFVDIDDVTPMNLAGTATAGATIVDWLSGVDAYDHLEITVESVTGVVTGVYGIIKMTKTS